MKISPENIQFLAKDEIFVFGSNLLGAHGRGAALLAAQKFGARQGVGVGMTGQCYAIPTKDKSIKPLQLALIAGYVYDFLKFAKNNPHLDFLVTKIGCGLAGYQPEDIAPLFLCTDELPANIAFPYEFAQFIG
jgi:hypothetical protein